MDKEESRDKIMNAAEKQLLNEIRTRAMYDAAFKRTYKTIHDAHNRTFKQLEHYRKMLGRYE